MSAPSLLLDKAEYQHLIFAEKPRRIDLISSANLLPEPVRDLTIGVYRNTPFEFIASLVPPFLAYTHKKCQFTFSDYDDSLSFNITKTNDIDIVWLDYDRYSLPINDLLKWLLERLSTLRKQTTSSILVSSSHQNTEPWIEFNQALRTSLRQLPSVYVLPIEEVAAMLGLGYLDSRFSSVGATRISDRANMELARQFALKWIPAALSPRLKAIVFDLDNTLWGGVLGEDGIHGLSISDEHRQLHYKINELANSGIIIGLLSRNSPDDVEEILNSGKLGLDHNLITGKSIGWGPKSDGMHKLAEYFRISFDSILFVDDNPGELAEVGIGCPEIHLLHARGDSKDLVRALDLYPGLFTWGIEVTDRLRLNDIIMNLARDAAKREANDPVLYMESLKVCINVVVNPTSCRSRLHQLSNKTNQFNLSLSRLMESDVSDYLESQEKNVVAVWLKDRFSNSGLIAGIFTHWSSESLLIIDDLCISCRALGRNLEDYIVLASIREILRESSTCYPLLSVRIGFSYAKGRRNEPALKWLSRLTGEETGDSGIVFLDWQDMPVNDVICTMPIQLMDTFPANEN